MLFCSCSDEVIFEEISNLDLSRSVDQVIEPSGKRSYYYYNHERVYVDIDKNKEYVIMIDSAAEANMVKPSEYNEHLSNYTGLLVNKAEDYENLASSKNMKVLAVEDVLTDGTPLSPYIYVSLKDTSDLSHLTKLAAQIEWTICGTKFWNENVKILCALPGSRIRSLKAACYIYEKGDYDFVDPGFAFTPSKYMF